jgi:AraC-like DNA-binding protein
MGSNADLLTEARLHTAKGLLRATDLSVLEVCLRSGFREVAHFHRMFRNRVGATPRRYRVENDMSQAITGKVTLQRRVGRSSGTPERWYEYFGKSNRFFDNGYFGFTFSLDRAGMSAHV